MVFSQLNVLTLWWNSLKLNWLFHMCLVAVRHFVKKKSESHWSNIVVSSGIVVCWHTRQWACKDVRLCQRDGSVEETSGQEICGTFRGTKEHRSIRKRHWREAGSTSVSLWVAEPLARAKSGCHVAVCIRWKSTLPWRGCIRWLSILYSKVCLTC